MSETKKKRMQQGAMRAAGILVVANFLSSMLGYVRNIIITSTFGMGMYSDAYYAAFTIPDTIYTVLVGGGLTSAFIPVFSGYIARGEDEDGYKMASTILKLVAIVVMSFCVVGEIFTPQLLPLIVDFSQGGEPFLNLTVKLTRIMFFQCFFMCLIGISMGILQSYKNFIPSSLGSIAYNFVMIIVGIMLYKAGLGIAGFSLGVVTGALVDFLIQAIPIAKSEFKYQKGLDLHHPGVRKFFRLFGPMLLGVSVSQLNLIVNKYFGTTVGESVLSQMQNAQSIMQLPINILGYSIAVSIFPTMVEHYSKGMVQNYKQDISNGIRSVMFLTLPASFGIIAVAKELIRALYLQGKFTTENMLSLSDILIFYAIGIVGYSIRQVLLQGFYAVSETKTPVKINIFILCLNMILSFIFVRVAGALGLGFAYSLAGLTSMALLMFFLKRKVEDYHGDEIRDAFIKIAASTVVMFVVIKGLSFLLEHVLPMERKIYQFLDLIILIGVGVLVYILMAFILKMKELTSVTDVLKRKFLHR